MNEEWRSCFDGFYAVSNMGRVRRELGGHHNAHIGRVLKADICNRYPRVELSCRGVKKKAFVHHLVAEAFLGARPDGLQINHRNGVKTDARAENLEYATATENMRHASAMGLLPSHKGERNSQSKMTDTQVREIRALHATTRITQREIAKRFGMREQNVSRILSGARWSHVA